MGYAIETEALTVTYAARRKAAPVHALQALNLRVEEGTVFGFLGPNGAGKTTTMQVLLGFVAPTQGTARMLGCDVREAIARQRIGYLPEHPQLYRFLTGRELLHMTGRLFGFDRAHRQARAEQLLRQLGLEKAADRRIATYSRGMMQRIGLAQALVNDPDLVILDEPTGGMDPLGRMEIRGIIAELRARGKTVFFSSHELSEVELVCDRIAILAQGRLAAEGKADTLVPAGESLEQFFLRTIRGGEDQPC